MDSIYYCKYIACKKRQINKKTACNCKVWVKVIKKRYLKSKNQYCMRFSNKIYFRYILQGTLHIICKPSKQYCPNCIQKDKK